MHSLDHFAVDKLDALEARALRRSLAETDRAGFPLVERGGRRLVSFSCNDYLGLSVEPRVKAAAAAAIERYGAGAGASRLVTGNHPLYAGLEARLAAAKGTQAACVFGSGYLANLGVIGALAGPEDLVVIDELAHACLHAGAALSRATILRFAHNDVAAVEALLRRHRAAHRHVLLATETVFSMDGDRAPLAALADLAARHDAWMLADDAHGFGVAGAPIEDAEAEVPLRIGTLSKALGSYGGYCCGSAPVIDLIRTRARPLIYTTGLPPSCVAAAAEALDILTERPELARAPLAKARMFTRAMGLPEARSAIVPSVLGAPDAALAASAALERAGFLVTAIRPPTVPLGTARLRFAFSARHADADILRLADALRAIMGLAEPVSERIACPASS